MEVDFLVIGSGLAGLNYVINVGRNNPDKQVLVITKSSGDESNTKYAQGGVAIVQDGSDSFDKHIQDTLIAGDGLCDKSVVELVVKEGPACLKELLNYGVDFDKDSDGKFDLGKEGGHSESRVVHFKDITGYEIEMSLLRQLEKLDNVTFLEHHFAIDLITQHHITNAQDDKQDLTCYGAYVLDTRTNAILRVLSKVTFLASGGIGQVYSHTTNPIVATGDGIAMGYRAKARIDDIEFVQFHPTALYDTEETPSFLISEAVRGFGAKLRTKSGALFMKEYDEREELASRDIVARAIDDQLKMSGDKYVLLDCTHLDSEAFDNHFPNIASKCKSKGIDPSKDMIPVVPAQHYSCGGLSTNTNGETSIANLLACGECSRTGLHGANRLASNSLLEAFVFSKRSASKAGELVKRIDINFEIPQWNIQGTTTPKELVLITHNRNEVQNIMWNYVGIVCSNERLLRAKERLMFLYQETESLYRRSKISVELCELRNMITVAYLITEHCLMRKVNRGGFYNSDLTSNSVII